MVYIGIVGSPGPSLPLDHWMPGVFATLCVGHHHEAMRVMTCEFMAKAAMLGTPTNSLPSLFNGQAKSRPLLNRRRSRILGSASHNLANSFSKGLEATPSRFATAMAQEMSSYTRIWKVNKSVWFSCSAFFWGFTLLWLTVLSSMAFERWK